MEHIENLIRALESDAKILTEISEEDAARAPLLNEAATALRNLLTGLRHANGMCRSASAIAERNGEADWVAFRAAIATSLQLQHEIMYPANMAEDGGR